MLLQDVSDSSSDSDSNSSSSSGSDSDSDSEVDQETVTKKTNGHGKYQLHISCFPLKGCVRFLSKKNYDVLFEFCKHTPEYKETAKGNANANY